MRKTNYYNTIKRSIENPNNKEIHLQSLEIMVFNFGLFFGECKLFFKLKRHLLTFKLNLVSNKFRTLSDNEYTEFYNKLDK